MIHAMAVAAPMITSTAWRESGASNGCFPFILGPGIRKMGFAVLRLMNSDYSAFSTMPDRAAVRTWKQWAKAVTAKPG
jgi:hypothetical protein